MRHSSPRVKPKEGRKVAGGCHSLQVIRVTGAHLCGEMSQLLSSISFQQSQAAGLIGDFGGYHRLPDSFLGGFGHGNLPFQQLELAAVPVYGQCNGSRHVGGVTQIDGNALFRQGL